MHILITNVLFTFEFDLLSIFLAAGLKQFTLEKDLVRILWYNVQERMK